MSKGRPEEAYRVVFGKPLASNELFTDGVRTSTGPVGADTVQQQSGSGGGLFQEIRGLYSSARNVRIACICHFAFFTASFTYYVTGESFV